MSRFAALQEVPATAVPSAAASGLTMVILDAATSIDRAFALTAAHLLTLPRVEAVSAALTIFAPDDVRGWVHLGERAWLTEWLRPGTVCSVVPAPDAGPEAALTMPWLSPLARVGALVLVDIDLLPPEAEQDRR